MFPKSLSPGACVHGCIHIYYSCACKRRNKATLLLEIRGSFILVLCVSKCMQVCVCSSKLSIKQTVCYRQRTHAVSSKDSERGILKEGKIEK